MSAAEVLIALATGLVAGVYGGLLGVGGGIIMVPSMVILLGQDQLLAQGTSLLVIIATGLSGTRANAVRGLIDRPAALWTSLGGAAGAVAGSLLALQVFDAASLRRIFGIVLVLIAIRLAIGPRRAPRSAVPGDG